MPLGDPFWQAWQPDEIARRLAGVEAPWCVAAGWAVDLCAGRRIREHDDLKIAVPADCFPEVRVALDDCAFEVVGNGRRWPEDSAAFALMHQTWVREPANGPYRLDVFREPHDGPTWICRRDPAIRRSYSEIVHRTPDGIPFLAPEIVLLFKAKAARDKDERDFAVLVPLLDDAQQPWLRDALLRVHPDHAWLAAL